MKKTSIGLCAIAIVIHLSDTSAYQKTYKPHSLQFKNSYRQVYKLSDSLYHWYGCKGGGGLFFFDEKDFKSKEKALRDCLEMAKKKKESCDCIEKKGSAIPSAY